MPTSSPSYPLPRKTHTQLPAAQKPTASVSQGTTTQTSQMGHKPASHFCVVHACSCVCSIFDCPRSPCEFPCGRWWAGSAIFFFFFQPTLYFRSIHPQCLHCTLSNTRTLDWNLKYIYIFVAFTILFFLRLVPIFSPFLSGVCVCVVFL